VDLLKGDPTKALEKLGWQPRYSLQALISEMVKADLELFRRDEILRREGFRINKEYE
jgi:GDPmannose 4,6-dehydratase